MISFRVLTKPQVRMLTKAMRDGAPVSGSGYRVADNLERMSLGKEHCGTFYVNAAGLKALRDYRAFEYANGGSMAQLANMEEVDAALLAEVS